MTLISTNAIGPSAPVTKTVTVLDPTPVVGSLTASPPVGFVCQPFTFTANNVGGQPIVTLSWKLDGVDVAGNGNPREWIPPVSTTPGLHTVTVTATNLAGSASKNASVTVNSLVPLPGAGFPIANDPFSAGVVTFHANADGATEWSWDFGDSGGVFGPWLNHPVNGPNPTHSYAAIGNYNVRVKVRNCAEAERTSATLPVVITQITPLHAEFTLTNPGFECQFLPACEYPEDVPVGFSDASTGAEFWDYDWNGDGTFEDTGHTSPVLQHTYPSAISVAFTPKLRVRRGASEQETVNLPKQLKIGAAIPPVDLDHSGPTSGLVGTRYTYTGFGQQLYSERERLDVDDQRRLGIERQ